MKFRVMFMVMVSIRVRVRVRVILRFGVIVRVNGLGLRLGSVFGSGRHDKSISYTGSSEIFLHKFTNM